MMHARHAQTGAVMKIEENTNDYLPLRDVVFNTLRESILKGEMKPGERLMEIHLANKLGVSRTPIREAIRKLELEGLEVRQALDALAMELACERISEEEIRALREACDRFAQVTRTQDAVKIAEADVVLHDIIVQGSRNEKLAQMVGNLSQQMYRYRLEYIKDVSQHVRLIEEHEEIYRCISSRDKDAGARAIKMHIYNQEQSIMNQIQQYKGSSRV